MQRSSHAHRYWHVANHILTAGTHDLKSQNHHGLERQLTEHLVWCVYVHVYLRVVVVCVWQGGESCGRRKFGRYHLSAYGHSSLGSLHQSLQLVCRNVFGSDQQHHLSITQETGPKLQETDCSFSLRQVSLLWRTVPCFSLRRCSRVPCWKSASQKYISLTKWMKRKWFHPVL